MRAFTVGLVLLLAAPAAAFGRGTPLTPAGNSAVGQYVEIIPTASGGRPSSSVHASDGSSSSQPAESNPLAASTQHALARDGRVGAQAAAVAEATAPRSVVRHVVRPKPGGPSSTAGATTATQSAVYVGPPAPRRSSASQVVAALTGSATHGGLGAVLPLLLI